MPETPSHDLEITRVFDAPRELVFRAFTDPDQLARWFGPVGFSVPRDTVEVDPRAGGVYRLTMEADDGSTTSPVNATFVEVVEHELIVGEEVWEGVPGQSGPTTLRLRLEFHDEGVGKTRLVLRQGPFTRELVDMSSQGWESSFTKLDTLLAS